VQPRHAADRSPPSSAVV